jgi:hypothetical protein
LQVPVGTQPVLSAPEIVVALHCIDAAKDGVPLKKVRWQGVVLRLGWLPT